LMVAEGCDSNNGTKANPCLQADLVGDWREEILLRTSDDTALRLYTTTDLTTLRIPTLMNDPMYRVAIAWQNSSYNQPPHPSFAIGEGMPEIGASAILRERKPETPAPDSPDGI
jgi:rhamnogalacturonan endolyase